MFSTLTRRIKWLSNAPFQRSITCTERFTAASLYSRNYMVQKCSPRLLRDFPNPSGQELTTTTTRRTWLGGLAYTREGVEALGAFADLTSH